jgi:hypothetical protein
MVNVWIFFRVSGGLFSKSCLVILLPSVFILVHNADNETQQTQQSPSAW